MKALAKLEALRDMLALRDYIDEGPVGKRRLPQLSQDELAGTKGKAKPKPKTKPEAAKALDLDDEDEDDFEEDEDEDEDDFDKDDLETDVAV